MEDSILKLTMLVTGKPLPVLVPLHAVKLIGPVDGAHFALKRDIPKDAKLAVQWLSTDRVDFFTEDFESIVSLLRGSPAPQKPAVAPPLPAEGKNK